MLSVHYIRYRCLMFTIQLWKALHNPPRHTLYHYLKISIQSQKSIGRLLSDIINSNVIFEFISVVIVLGLCLISCLLLIYIIVFIPLLIPAVGTYFALSNALKTGNMLTREHRSRRYELLATSPIGIGGTHWFIATTVCTTNEGLKQLTDVARAIYVFMFIGTAIVIFQRPLLQLNHAPLNALAESVLTVLPFVIILVLIFVDFIQSNVLGCIIGMLVPIHVQHEIEAGGLILGGFLLAQIIFYIFVGIGIFAIWSYISTLREDFGNTLIIGTLGISVLFIIREFLIMQLWRYLVEALDTDMAELKRTMNLSA